MTVTKTPNVTAYAATTPNNALADNQKMSQDCSIRF